MLTISNIYGHGFDHRQLSRLETLGFSIRPQVSRYMGAQICRFIDFEAGPALELIEVEHKKEYLDFVPKGMKAYSPGISLVVPAGSPARLTDYADALAHLHPYTLHVNYDGSTDRKGPGWHYLNFEIPLVPDTFIWLTGFDEPRLTRAPNLDHPNGVTGVLGLVFDLAAGDVQELLKLGQGEFVDGALQIGGLNVWLKSALDGFPDVKDKAFPLIAIILKAENLDFFTASMDGVRNVTCMSRPAIHIETNRLSWDLLVAT